MDHFFLKDLDCGGDDESDEIGCYTNMTRDASADPDSDGLSCASTGSQLCEHNCTDISKLNGFVCSCYHGYHMAKSNISSDILVETNSTIVVTPAPATTDIRRHTCVDIDECELVDLNHCVQSCANTKGSYRCSCGESYTDPHGDGSICEAAYKEDSVVLIAYGTEIRQLRANISEYAYNALIDNENFVTAMDVDPLERVIYWIDAPSAEIKRSFIPVSKNAQGFKQTLGGVSRLLRVETETNGLFLTALAVDWLGKNIFFAEALNKTIRVCKLDGRYCKILIDTEVDDVYSMAVNPTIGMIFWINKGRRHRIMSASMNGENVRALVDSNLDSPTGLAVDYFKNNRVYWSDRRRNLVESVNYDGTDRVRMRHTGMHQPFKIDVFENHVYWLSENEGLVGKVDKYGRGARIDMIHGLDLVEDLKVFHSFKVPNSGKLFENIQEMPRCNLFHRNSKHKS
jgi:hypothetical protein